MSDKVTKGERIKAAFGVISKNILTEKKKQVGDLIDKLENEMSTLAKTTSDTHMAYHPGEAGMAKKYKTLRERLTAVPDNPPDLKTAYNECVAIEKQTNAALKSVPAMKESEKQIDGMKTKAPGDIDKLVKALGSSVKSDKDKGTVIAAIKVRYDLDELSGELSSNMLPRLYEVLSLIPANHTKDNPMFKSIKRSKMSDTSLYWNGTGEIAINGGETGPFSSKREKYNDSTGKKLEFSKFDAHTLHEVGHSVDDASGYMAKHQKDESHGGWKLTDSSGAAAAKAKAMQPAYKTLSLAFLRDVVAAVLGNGNADGAVLTWKGKKGGFDEITADGLRDDGAIKVADAGIKKVKDQVSVPLSSADKLKVSVEVPSLTELMKNSVAQGAAKQVVLGVLRNMTELVQTADEAIGGLKASIDAANDTALVGKLQKEAQDWGEIIKKELWYNPGAIAGAQAGGRVYQSDEGTWWSYSFAARSAAVNNYQWRSPAEWFAEVYTVEMLNKLDKSHPCSGKLRQIDTTQKIV